MVYLSVKYSICLFVAVISMRCYLITVVLCCFVSRPVPVCTSLKCCRARVMQ